MAIGRLLLVAATLTACAPEPEPEPEVTFETRPGTRADTIHIEGMPEATSARLFLARELDPPFSTYVPQGVTEAIEATGDSGAVRFTAAFTGREDPNAYMHVRLYPRGTNLLGARNVVAGFLRSRYPQDEPVEGTYAEPSEMPMEAPPWGLEAHGFSYSNGGIQYIGHITLAQHGPRFFHVLVHYPAEYGDGLGPRFDYILRHWRWEDTGSPLQR